MTPKGQLSPTYLMNPINEGKLSCFIIAIRQMQTGKFTQKPRASNQITLIPVVQHYFSSNYEQQRAVYRII